MRFTHHKILLWRSAFHWHPTVILGRWVTTSQLCPLKCVCARLFTFTYGVLYWEPYFFSFKDPVFPDVHAHVRIRAQKGGWQWDWRLVVYTQTHTHARSVWSNFIRFLSSSQSRDSEGKQHDARRASLSCPPLHRESHPLPAPPEVKTIILL